MLGATVFLAGFKFMLVKADEYTEKYMEDNEGAFPQASLTAIIEKMKKGSKGFANLQEYAIHMMKVLDKNNDGFVDVNEFSVGL